jgi:DNA-binding transcriptional MerR regulator
MGVREKQLTSPERSEAKRSDSRPRKALTIGAVCKILGQEFDDISISKIRYLEDQKLLSPRRTSGGYRLYSQTDVDRLRTILRLQRDEFLPLRVIRQELASGAVEENKGGGPTPGALRRVTSVAAPTSDLNLEQLIEDTGAGMELVVELEDFGIIQPEAGEDGQRVYDETDREIVRAAGELARFGVASRNLRVFRTSADREAALLEQVLGPALRSRNPARRKEALENLESMAGVVSQLKHLLLVRDLRRLTGE